jgi:hypothetical protein
VNQANATMCFKPNPSRSANWGLLAILPSQWASRRWVASRKAQLLSCLNTTDERKLQSVNAKRDVIECLVNYVPVLIVNTDEF